VARPHTDPAGRGVVSPSRVIINLQSVKLARDQHHR
jgi:hypothetical protein